MFTFIVEFEFFLVIYTIVIIVSPQGYTRPMLMLHLIGTFLCFSCSFNFLWINILPVVVVLHVGTCTTCIVHIVVHVVNYICTFLSFLEDDSRYPKKQCGSSRAP